MRKRSIIVGAFIIVTLFAIVITLFFLKLIPSGLLFPERTVETGVGDRGNVYDLENLSIQFSSKNPDYRLVLKSDEFGEFFRLLSKLRIIHDDGLFQLDSSQGVTIGVYLVDEPQSDIIIDSDSSVGLILNDEGFVLNIYVFDEVLQDSTVSDERKEEIIQQAIITTFHEISNNVSATGASSSPEDLASDIDLYNSSGNHFVELTRIQ